MFDIYFCGSWVQSNWDQKCKQMTNTESCQYFKNAYWIIHYVDVYQLSP